MTPELKARVSIDALLVAAGWHVCNVADINIHTNAGAAIHGAEVDANFQWAETLQQVSWTKAFAVT